MKLRRLYLPALLLAAILLIAFNQSGPPVSAGKYHPASPGRSHTRTVTVLNPALFHRLNTILEHGLIQGD